MIRTTLYGTLTHDEELNKNEKAMLYIKECAELEGLEVIEGETAFSVTFMAEIMKRLRETIDSEHQWIPVSSGKLPKDGQRIWYTDAWNGVYQATFLSLPRGDFFGSLNPSKVKAWMPCFFPEPYKEEHNADK